MTIQGEHTTRTALGFVMLALLITASAFGTTMAATHPPPSAKPDSEVQLTSTLAFHIDPRFSPDGRSIAYASNQSGSYSIWTMTADGREQTEVTSLPGEEVMPTWSPDGNRIAFLWKHGAFSDLCIVSVNVDAQACATKGAHVRNLAWNPNGSVIAYDAGNGTIRLYNTASGADTVFPFGARVRDPDFGPSSVLYFSARSDQGDYIWKAALDGGGSERLSHTGSDIEPHVSPSGGRVMYLTNLSGRYEPWLIDTETGISRYLFDTPDLAPSYTFPSPPLMANGTVPSWGPNGTSVLFIADSLGTGTLYLVTMDFTVTLSTLTVQGRTFVINVYNKVPIPSPVVDAQWSPRGDAVVETTVSGAAQLLLLRNGPPVSPGYGG